jgi:Cu(I)/Ag(I) efflux system membrane protein CusA/SilA
MMDRLLGRLIEFSMRRSGRVIFAFIVLSLLGAWAAWRSPLDAIPDLSDPQVLLYSHVPGSPEQIAQTVTAPMMKRLRAVAGVRTLRGFSDLGYSYVTALVDDSAELGRVRGSIEAETRKDAAQVWQVASDASGVGWVYQYALASPDGGQDLYQLRALQEEVLGPALAALAGVAEVAPVGGYSRRFEVVANPRLLETQGVKPWQLTQALAQATGPMRGRMLMLGERDVILGLAGSISRTGAAQALTFVPESASDLEALPILVHGKAHHLGDLARVRQAPDLRRGIADLNGEGEVVGGIVIARKGVNALELIRRVETKLESLKKGLPAGVQVVPVYDRSALILSSLRTVRRELIQELLLVALVVVLFLGHWRSVLVLSIALPVTIFLHFIPLHLAGLSMNLMTLGGLAIAIGDILDAGIILVENGNRALADAQGGGEDRRLAALKLSALLLIRPLFFTLLIVVVSFLPVFALEGQEGRLFLPLAASKSLSMLSALAVTVILIPALCARYLRGHFIREEEQPLMARLQAWYRPSLAWVLERPWASLAVNFSVLALTIPLLLSLPREFLPPLNEGSLLYMPVTAAGVPAAQAGAMLKEVDRRLMEVPEVDRVFGKAGRAESATDPAPLSMIESTVMLKPRSTWRKGMDEAALVKEMDAKLSFVGLSNGWTQPIRGRIDMQSTGVRTPLGIKVFAPSLEAAERAAVQLEQAASNLPGVRSAAAERAAKAPLLSVSVDLSAAAKVGLTADEVLGQVLAHAGGSALAQAKGVPVAVLYPEDFTDSLPKMQAFPIFTPRAGVLPLSRLAQVELRQGPDMVAMENGQASATVYLDLKDRDVMGWVQQQRAKLPLASALGPGVSYQFSGQYEADQRARRRLLWLLPLCLVLIAGMLALAFGSIGEAALVMLSVPFALIGGVWIQALLGIPLSVSVWVGYIALFAVAVQTGVVMVVYLQEALNHRLAQGPVDGQGLKAVVMEGAVLRLRPKLMTVATNVIGFVPMLWTKGPGDDLLASVAAPLVGGMLSSAVHVLYITPVLFLITKRRLLARGAILKAQPKSELL